ncbi:BnaC01g40960D [Brassica napus]|uniref:BnaC01g40960D protein n=1 Tax=Brassica napus TaxID=3708 RepID=A0A078JBA1_BRANA|nr:BnaC01g40960D [Brassica napus]
MDSEDTKRQKRVFSLLALRFCTVIVFSVVSFFVLSFILGVLVIILGELWVSSSTSSASLASRCKILSSSVDLRSSKVCGIGLLNNKAQHVFHPFERDKFRCRYDYYWASVFKVEYKDHLMGQTRLAFSEAPNEALPPECRPNFGAALLTKDNFKAGIPKIKLYQDGFFGCQANDLSFTDIFKQYAVLLSKLLQSWFNGKGRPKYWRYDVIAGIVSGFSTSIITVLVVRILSNAKSWFPRACCSVKSKLSKVNLFVQVKRACLVIAYFYILGWMATQYLKIIFPKA